MAKKGDIVRIKTYDELVNEFGAPNEDGVILCGYTYPNPKSSRKVPNYFTEDMQKLCGRTGIITSMEEPHKIILNDARYLDPDYQPDPTEETVNWMFNFSKEMFVENV